MNAIHHCSQQTMKEKSKKNGEKGKRNKERILLKEVEKSALKTFIPLSFSHTIYLKGLCSCAISICKQQWPAQTTLSRCKMQEMFRPFSKVQLFFSNKVCWVKLWILSDHSGASSLYSKCLSSSSPLFSPKYVWRKWEMETWKRSQLHSKELGNINMLMDVTWQWKYIFYQEQGIETTFKWSCLRTGKHWST